MTVRTVAGYLLINSATFATDLAILVALHGELRWPLPLAVTIGYATAFTLSFALNRRFNFRSHAPVGPQLARYAVAVLINFVAFILGVTNLLSWLGVDYRLARVVAGGCEAIFLYCVMRWVLFRDVLPSARGEPAAVSSARLR